MLNLVDMLPRLGSSIYTSDLSWNLIKQGHQVHIITRGTAQRTSRQEVVIEN